MIQYTKQFGLDDDDLRTFEPVYRPGLLKGQVAIVSGAGTGIGRGIAAIFAKLGATLVICGRNEERLTEAAEFLREFGNPVDAVPMSIREPEAVEQLMDRDWVVPGLGDAGAHVGQIMDSGWPSFFLSHWVRDTGKLPIEAAIQRMTQRAAKVLALGDRGELAVGKRADVNVLDLDKVEDPDERTGAAIINRALEEPLRQISENGGLEGSVVVNKVREMKDGEGLNAATGEYGDMVKAGVLDPTVVTRSALQNAASIAKNILTTEAIVAEPPEEGGAMPAMPDMGGMGGMM